MLFDPREYVWILLLVMGYLLVTCMLMVLSHTRKRALDIHNRVRECMEIRRKYMLEQQRVRDAR